MSISNKGKHHTEEAKKKMSIAKTGKPAWNSGKHHSIETRNKIRKSLLKNSKGKLQKDYIYTEEHRNKIKESNIGKHKGKLNGRCRPVIQYDLEGNFIKRYDYTKQASEELNINRKSIIMCCKGIYKQAGGYKFNYI